MVLQKTHEVEPPTASNNNNKNKNNQQPQPTNQPTNAFLLRKDPVVWFPTWGILQGDFVVATQLPHFPNNRRGSRRETAWNESSRGTV